MVSGSAVTQVKAVILGPVRRIPLGTGPEVVGKVLGTVRLAILGASPRVTVFGTNPPHAITPVRAGLTRSLVTFISKPRPGASPDDIEPI